MSNRESLQQIIETIRPSLETELSDCAHATFHFGHESRNLLPLQLRIPICGLASRALQNVLREQHNIDTELMGVTTNVIPGYRGEPVPHRHVMLHTETDAIDPTFGQYMGLFGLFHGEVIRDPNLMNMYPSNRIAIYSLAQAAHFAEEFANHGHSLAPIIPKPEHKERSPYGILRNASLKESVNLMQELWNPSAYEAHKLGNLDSEEQMQIQSHELADLIMHKNS